MDSNLHQNIDIMQWYRRKYELGYVEASKINSLRNLVNSLSGYIRYSIASFFSFSDR